MNKVDECATKYYEFINGYDMDGHDAALLTLALAIENAAEELGYSINRNDRAMSVGEALVAIANSIQKIGV